MVSLTNCNIEGVSVLNFILNYTAYAGDQWVSFDDISMVEHKSEYIKAMG